MNRMRENTPNMALATTADHERNLDALLEDLQTTVSRSNSTMNLNGNVTGYREVRRTYTDGTPEGTMTDYQIEYLNPANSTQHITESGSYHNGMQNTSGQRSKTVTKYKYNTVESTSGSGDMKLKQNISELDSLLDDLNTAQKKNFTENTTISHRNMPGTDVTGYLDQGSSGHNTLRSEQKHYSEERSLRGRSPSTARRELVFTGQRSQDPSPMREQMYFEQQEQSPKVQQFYRYEKTTSTRTTGPTVTDMPPLPEPGSLQSSTVRNYTYTDESPLPLRHRSPSPVGGGSTIHSYHYTSSSKDVPPPQSPPLDKYKVGYPDDYPSSRGPPGTNVYNYSSSTVRESRSDSRGKTPPPPHRSPSPVSFSQPPPPTRSTTVKTYSYDQHVTSGGVPPPHSPPIGQKFSPSDPTHNRLTYNVSPATPPPHPSPHHTTVTNYKYSTTTSAHHQSPDETLPLMPRPFPTPQPSPTPHSEQQPPKKLDELMASFSDADQRQNRYMETTVHHYTSSNSTPHQHPTPQAVTLHPSNENEKLIEKERENQRDYEKEKLVTHDESKNITGPPVYYPPGVELFAKKEESMMQQQSGGGRYRAKAKYEYEAKSKSKMKESSGKAVVPVCLPLCCAMPCVIM